jgi:hypothetical protein
MKICVLTDNCLEVGFIENRFRIASTVVLLDVVPMIQKFPDLTTNHGPPSAHIATTATTTPITTGAPSSLILDG